ncbi:thioesterase II family protein [Streptomyces sp. BI20]|uniref:thioesterase II family protein n=1 Tax=Streptomyces sp. BI20 TaxID=3403460 RepID=UPI003C72BFEA
MSTLPRPGAWFRRFSAPPEGGTTLLCFPHAGGAAATYFPYARLLAPTAGVYGVQYPGRHDRGHEPLVDDLTELADLITTAVRAEPSLAGPAGGRLVLFGHSMGALVAYEVARRLEAAPGPGPRPARLIVSGARAPDLPRLGPPVHGLPDEALITHLQRLDGTSAEVLADSELVRMVLPTLRADYKAVESYRGPAPTAGGALTCPISVFTGTEDPHVDTAGAARWAEFAPGASAAPAFDLEPFPGGHFFVNARREAVADALSTRLAGVGALGT